LAPSNAIHEEEIQRTGERCSPTRLFLVALAALLLN
jgi:hypothetical protein